MTPLVLDQICNTVFCKVQPLSPLLFRINIIHCFYQCDDSDIGNYVDGRSSYFVPLAFPQSSNFFDRNHMEANPGKYHL